MKNICLFLPTGRTLSFRDIVIISNNESFLTFDYRAMSDSLIKTGTFQKRALVGWSIHEEK